MPPTYVIPLGILGACLVVLTVFTPLGKALKIFMVIAGGSAAGWPISLYLHSLFFPVFPAEPVTYILVFLVLPVVFMVGLLGAAVIGIKQIVGRK